MATIYRLVKQNVPALLAETPQVGTGSWSISAVVLKTEPLMRFFLKARRAWENSNERSHADRDNLSAARRGARKKTQAEEAMTSV